MYGHAFGVLMVSVSEQDLVVENKKASGVPEALTGGV